MPHSSRLKSRIKKLGVLGFLFFLLKGLAWLALPYLVAQGIL